MNQTATTTNSLPSQLSPDFVSWLESEKLDARRHRQRIVKAAFFIAIGFALFFLKEQAGLFEEVADAASVVTAR